MKRPVAELKGVGPARAALLEETGIRTIGDLLYYLPRRHVDRTVAESTVFADGKPMTLIVRVESKFLAHGRKSRLVVNTRTVNGESVTLMWFNAARYFIGVFETGQTLVVSGKLEFRGGMQIVHPEYEFLDTEDETALLHVGRIVPLYPSTDALKKKGLDSRGFRRLIAAALELSDLAVPELLPEPLTKRYNYPARATALRQIHYPDETATLRIATEYLKYEELYLFNAMMYKKTQKRREIPRHISPLPYAKSKHYASLLKSLPFELTGEQTNAIQEILSFAEQNYAYEVLLQGDVGSGKTIVALAILLHYVENGLQAAIMAPTEVLARQHFRTIVSQIGLVPGVTVDIMTGHDTKKRKEQLLSDLATGNLNLIVGTHALIEEGVTFENLGIVVIDEQHRFGVNQREALRAKGDNPDLVAMTATPIPRTLCLTEFADLHTVVLKEKPAGRRPIKTMWLREEKRPGLYKSIRNHVGNGRQCYIVYPVIDESKNDLRAATDGYEELKNVLFPEFRVELLHGRMKGPEKERIMSDFRSGDVKILVATTVIEVGVDVANATIMVIEHADRFGISQLHQLRGRVGRGAEESFCVLMAEPTTEEGAERLRAIEASDDGFYLSEVDLKVRGPGELLGNRQHGISGLRIANLIEDREIVERAFADIRTSPELNGAAIEALRRQFEEGALFFPK